MRPFVFIATVIILAVVVYPQEITDIEKLVETERSFARDALEKGTKAAFLEYLADDSIVFEPTAVNGREVWSKKPDSAALLSWRPVWADISGHGTLGYTTGPWEFRPKGKNDEPVAFGQYVTIWKKQNDGKFKAVLDIGISHGKQEVPAEKIRYPADAGDSSEKVKSLEGPFKYLENSIGNDTKLYRDGEFPIIGNAVLERLKLEKREYGDFGGKCEVENTELRYCYGIVLLSFESKEPQRGNYLQIHKFRAGKWEIVLDLFAALPVGMY